MRLVSSLISLGLAASVSAAPITVEPLVRTGETYNGIAGEVIGIAPDSRINNSGQWTFEVVANNPDGSLAGRYLVAYDGVRFDPTVGIPFNKDLTIGPVFVPTAFASINNHGQVAVTVSGPTFNSAGEFFGTRSMLVVDDHVVLRSGDSHPFGGTYPSDFGDSKSVLVDDGSLLVNFDLFSNPFAEEDTVIRLTPGMGKSYEQSVSLAPGMAIEDGYFVRSTNRALWGSFDHNQFGDTVHAAITTNDDFDTAGSILLNGQFVARDGETQLFDNGLLSIFPNRVAINDNADFVYLAIAQSSEWEGGRYAVIKNADEVVWVDDGSTPDLAGKIFTAFMGTHLSLANSGDVFWQGDFFDAMGARYTAVFRNSQMLATTDPSIDGVVRLDGLLSFDASDNGEWLIFDTESGVFRAQIPSPAAMTVLALGVLPALRRRP
ncbi:MAG: hypothetical protein ABL309_13620 [Phycisphaerales bacterium]